MTARKGRLSARKNKQSNYHIRRKAATARRMEEKKEEEDEDKGCEAKEFLGFDVEPLKPGLRVLSLFDGISTALVALQNLELHVKKYFSSEVDENALRIQRQQFGEQVLRLGCVKTLSSDKLDCLGIINLLIGGSPCSDLTLLNPRRRGLHGPGSTGALFFEFVRVLKYLRCKAESEGRTLSWCFENTSKLEVKARKEMSSALGMEPVVRDALDFLPVHRKRFFWGNLEGMDKAPVNTMPKMTLEDILGPFRYSVVTCIPTLTTTAHSQRTGKGKCLPVIEDGQESALYITEVESLFGFPKHFTDGPNLSVTGRRSLLGKAFCVPVIQHILEPLKQHFWTLPKKN